MRFVKAVISCQGGVISRLQIQLPRDNVALNIMAGAGAGGLVAGYLMEEALAQAQEGSGGEKTGEGEEAAQEQVAGRSIKTATSWSEDAEANSVLGESREADGLLLSEDVVGVEEERREVDPWCGLYSVFLAPRTADFRTASSDSKSRTPALPRGGLEHTPWHSLPSVVTWASGSTARRSAARPRGNGAVSPDTHATAAAGNASAVPKDHGEEAELRKQIAELKAANGALATRVRDAEAVLASVETRRVDKGAGGEGAEDEQALGFTKGPEKQEHHEEVSLVLKIREPETFDTEPNFPAPLSRSAISEQLVAAKRQRVERVRAELVAGSAMPLEFWQRRQELLAGASCLQSDLTFVHAVPSTETRKKNPEASANGRPRSAVSSAYADLWENVSGDVV